MHDTDSRQEPVRADDLIFGARARVVAGVLTSEAILTDLSERARDALAGTALLATGLIGDGRQAVEAASALHGHGIVSIIGSGFARPFFRACLNIGLPPLTLWEVGEIRQGDRLRVDVRGLIVKDLSSGLRYPVRDLSDSQVEILACGGMQLYLRTLRAEARTPDAADEPG